MSPKLPTTIDLGGVTYQCVALVELPTIDRSLVQYQRVAVMSEGLGLIPNHPKAFFAYVPQSTLKKER